VNAIYSASGNWRIDETGLLVVEEIKAKRLELEDEDTGETYCVRVKSGEFLHTQGACSTANSNDQVQMPNEIQNPNDQNSEKIATSTAVISDENIASAPTTTATSTQ
jgi:hypothetical protein